MEPIQNLRAHIAQLEHERAQLQSTIKRQQEMLITLKAALANQEMSAQANIDALHEQLAALHQLVEITRSYCAEQEAHRKRLEQKLSRSSNEKKNIITRLGVHIQVNSLLLLSSITHTWRHICARIRR